MLAGFCVALANPVFCRPGLQSAVPSSHDSLALLEGTWVRDEAISDDLGERIEDLQNLRPGGGFGSHRGSAAGRSGRLGGARGSTPGSVRGIPGAPGVEELELLERIGKEIEVVRLERAGELLTITDALRQTRLIPLDDRRVADAFGGEVRAFLEGPALVIESRSGSRLRRERLLLDQELLRSGRLEWHTTLQGSGSGDIEFRTLYERVGEPPVEQTETVSTARTVTTPATRVGDEPDIVRARRPEQKSPDQSSPDQSSPEERVSSQGGSVIRLLPPEGRNRRILEGKILFQTLTIDPTVAGVEFLIDDVVVAKRSLPPWEAKLDLPRPARQLVVGVRALNDRGSVTGEDQLTVNRLDPPFAVAIDSLAAPGSGARSGEWSLGARVAIPRRSRLREVSLFVGDQQVETLETFDLDPVRNVTRIEARVSAQGNPGEFVRVVAALDDGSTLEDVVLLDDGQFRDGQFSERVDVELVELQVLVTDKGGRPVTELSADDFEVREGKVKRDVAALYPAQDLPLVLGLAIDSSGSMAPIWRETLDSSERFLNQTLDAEDRAFIVDFDTRLRLLEPVTGDKARLTNALGRLSPEGGTALYDSILFSLLQYGGQPGRRALVVLTDGFDADSKADPQRAIEFAKRLGVPVYVIALAIADRAQPISGRSGSRPGSSGVGGSGSSFAQSARNSLRVITDPTGGRLFQVRSLDRMAWVFEQIEAELRSQFVLTYYSSSAGVPGDVSNDKEPQVKVVPKGLSVRSSRVSER